MRSARVKWHWAVLVFAMAGAAQVRPDFQVDVNLVRIPCVVADASGAPVAGLHREDFAVFEDGARREVKYLWQESDLPLTIGLIADISGSERRLIGQHRQTLAQFLAQILAPDDRAFLVSVERQQRLVTDLTNSGERLHAGVQGLTRRDAAILGDPCAGRSRRVLFTTIMLPCGGTALWNGVYFAARLKLRPQAGRKALLLLTDGWDTGSEHGLTDAIEAAQGADAMVYSIRYADAVLNHAAGRQLAKGKRDLQRITRETGGQAFESESESTPAIFNRIEIALRSEYVVGYELPQGKQKPGYHKIKVKLSRPGLTVRAREGYWEQ